MNHKETIVITGNMKVRIETYMRRKNIPNFKVAMIHLIRRGLESVAEEEELDEYIEKREEQHVWIGTDHISKRYGLRDARMNE